MITYYSISAAINIIISVVLAVVVFWSGNTKINRSFVYFSLSVALWSVGYFFWQISSYQQEALFWTRFLMMGAILIPATYAHFVFSFLNIYEKKKKILFVSYVVTVFFEVFVFSNLIVKNVSPILGFDFWPVPGYLFHPFLFLWIIYTAYVTYILFKKYLLYVNSEKTQIKYLLLGLSMGFLGGATNYFLWYNIPIPPVGNAFVALYVIFIFYAIVKHSLFDIKVIIAEALVFSLWIILSVKLIFLKSLSDILIESAVLILFIFFGVLLIRSVSREVKRREETEKLVNELKKANEKLKQVDEQKSEFISIASHQLRTPLTAIKGYTSMLIEGTYGEVSDKAKGIVSKIFQSSQRLVYIVNDMLDVSRIEEGRLKYTFEDVKINNLVKDVIGELKVNADFKKLKFNFSADSESLDVVISADYGKIRQAIINIIDNSIKYTEEGFVSVSLEISKNKNSLILNIKDSGIGMTKNQLKTIFEKFKRSKNAIKMHTEGSGLGLYVAKEMIKSNKGVIWATSDGLGKGSQFYIEFPIKKEK